MCARVCVCVFLILIRKYDVIVAVYAVIVGVQFARQQFATEIVEDVSEPHRSATDRTSKPVLKQQQKGITQHTHNNI